MNFENIRINDAYSKIYAQKKNVNESVETTECDTTDNAVQTEAALDARNGGPSASGFEKEDAYGIAIRAQHLLNSLAKALRRANVMKDDYNAFLTLKLGVESALQFGYDMFGKNIMNQKGRIAKIDDLVGLKTDFTGTHTPIANEAEEDANSDEKDAVTKVFFIKSVEPNSGDEEIIAIFPEEKWNPSNDDEVASYAHVGQHGPASLSWAKEQTAATKDEYAPLYDELVNDVGYKLDVIESEIAEAEDGSEDENSGNKEIFTLDIQDIERDEGVDDMKWSVTYFDFDQACDAAMECAKEYEDADTVINVSVMSGEYQKPNGDVYGEPEAVYTVSNKNEEITAAARKKANFVSPYVDGYVTDGKPNFPELDNISAK